MSAVTVVELAWQDAQYSSPEPATRIDCISDLVLVVVRTRGGYPAVEDHHRIEMGQYNHAARVWTDSQGCVLVTDHSEKVTHWAYAALPPEVAS